MFMLLAKSKTVQHCWVYHEIWLRWTLLCPICCKLEVGRQINGTTPLARQLVKSQYSMFPFLPLKKTEIHCLDRHGKGYGERKNVFWKKKDKMCFFPSSVFSKQNIRLIQNQLQNWHSYTFWEYLGKVCNHASHLFKQV